MTNHNKITYSGIVPLVGGMMFGMKKVIGSDPEYILSYKEFAGNDRMFLDYMYKVPFYEIDSKTNICEQELSTVDIVATLCPCAGLSQLNNGKKRGADAPQNDWMYKTAEYVLEKLSPKVFWGENAPGLYGSIGEPVVEKLRKIGEKNQYSMTLLRTTTMLHGIPQHRVRTFYFFWKSEHAPLLNWYNVESPTLEEYLARVDKHVLYEDKVEKSLELQTDPLYMWLKKEFGDWRSFMREKKGSMMDVMINSGKAKEYIDWVKIHHPDHSKKAEHALYKRNNGMGFWDSSPFLPTGHTGAFTGARMNAIHPVEDRVLTRRELMHFMGLPNDMKIPHPDNMGRVFQNVPSDTAADWTREVVKFVEGKLEKTDYSFVKQDNISQRIEVPSGCKSISLF